MSGLFGGSALTGPTTPRASNFFDVLLGGTNRADAIDARREMASARNAMIAGLFGGAAPGAAEIARPAAPAVSATLTEPATVGLDKLDLGALKAPASPPVRSLREMLPILGPAILRGVPGAKEMIDLFDKTGPQMDVVNGVAYDKRGTAPGTRIGVNGANVNGTIIDLNDPANIDRYVPEPATKGQRPVYDRYTGQQTGWEMMPGSVEGVAATAAAEAGGRASAAAPYEMVEVPLADGRKLTLPKSQFLEFSKGGGSPAMPGLGVAQSPAEAKAAELAAATAAERAAITPKARAALDSQARVTDLVLEKITEALAQVGGNTAGLGAVTKFIPGTAPYNLSTTLDTIKSNVGFDKLADMRANSPTGGALGSVSEKENALLQSVLGSIDQGQSPQQLKSNLERIQRELSAARDARKSAYDRLYAQPAAPVRQPAAMPARRGGSGGGYSVVNVRRAQ